MNLLQAIHQRWAAAADLDALLSSGRVFTGLSPDAKLPLALLSKQGQRPGQHFNDGSATAVVELRLEVLHGQYSAGAAVVGQVQAAFDHASFALAGNDKVVDMRMVNESERQNDDGVWQFTCDFHCTVFLAAQ